MVQRGRPASWSSQSGGSNYGGGELQSEQSVQLVIMSVAAVACDSKRCGGDGHRKVTVTDRVGHVECPLPSCSHRPKLFASYSRHLHLRAVGFSIWPDVSLA